MYIPKKYGQSKIDKCPFCQKHATALNAQSVPVCTSHKGEKLKDLKCVCGSILDVLKGKYGVFFSCMKCGNMNLKKVLEFNTVKPKAEEKTSSSSSGQQKSKQLSVKKETTVRSDDPRYFD